MPSTVFIVDDEKNIRRTVRMVLEGEGYAVEEASSGEEALARIAEIGADVVLLDVQLPGDVGAGDHRTHRQAQEPRFGAHHHHDLGARDAGGRGARHQGRRLRPDREAARSRAVDGRAAQRARAARDGARGAGPARDGRRALRDGGQERADGGAVRPDREGRADADPGADHRRVGDGQGADRARASPRQHAGRQAVREGQLRRHPARADRVRAVRARARRVHGRDRAQAGPVRARRRRHHLPRRGGRHDRLGAGEGAARAAVGRVHARRRRTGAEGRRARRRRHQPRPAGGGRGERVPRGSVLPPQRRAAARAAAARSRRRTCRCCRGRSSSSPAARTA